MAATDFDKQLQQTNVLLKLTRLREEEDFCDLTIKCGDKEIQVHRNVVSAHSDWFLKACAGGFKESQSPMIELPGDDPEEVEAMLNFCYKFEYPAAEEFPLTFHARMFAIGEKYLMEPLQSYAAHQFSQCVLGRWIITDFTSAVAIAYTAAIDPGNLLRKRILTTSFCNYAVLFGNNSENKKAMDSVPAAYTLDVLRAAVFLGPFDTGIVGYRCPTEGCSMILKLVRKLPDVFQYQCSKCKQTHKKTAEQWQKQRPTLEEYLERERQTNSTS